MEVDAWPQRSLPVNSKRLNTSTLRQLARGLEIPTNASGEETRQLIEGKLGELGRDAKNTQVLVQEREDGVWVCLRDMEGVFLEVEPAMEVEGGEEKGEKSEEEEKGEESEEEVGSVEELRHELQVVKEAQAALESEVDDLRQRLEREKAKSKELWKLNCAQLTEFDGTLGDKEEEIAQLKRRLAEVATVGSGTSKTPERVGFVSEAESVTTAVSKPSSQVRRSKAPPVPMFSDEDPEVTLNDWLPSLKRAAQWNGWGPEEQLMQLAGHLKSRALQEWNLMTEADKDSYDKAVTSLGHRLDPGSKALAALDFRHLSQDEKEKAADYIARLEKTFRLAYGKDSMATEIRDTLLFSQIQVGLSFNLMESPAVSGANSYQFLCVAAKSEERRQAALRKRKQYQGDRNPSSRIPGKQPGKPQVAGATSDKTRFSNPQRNVGDRKCWRCQEVGHLSKDCPKPKESAGRFNQKPPAAKMIRAPDDQTEELQNPLSYHLLDSDEASVKQIRVLDRGSVHQQARVVIAGVPVVGAVDTGSDLTIMGGGEFKQVAVAARLHKKDFRPADKNPFNYDRKPLGGWTWM